MMENFIGLLTRRITVVSILEEPLQHGFEQFVQRALAQPGLSRRFHATGIDLHYLEWEGPPGAPALLLLHGFMAHAHWWDFIAPWLAQQYRVIAPDFGGMGDSGHREHYSVAQCIDEIGAVIEHTGIAPCIAIGHSFGGRTLLQACARHPQAIARAVVVDSRLTSPDDPLRSFKDMWRPKRRYPDQQTMLDRFVLMPEEPAPALAMAHMARCGSHQDGDAWIWKFDDRILLMDQHNDDDPRDEAADMAWLPMPVDIIRGEFSRVATAERCARLSALLPTAGAPIELPGSYHHLPVSQPLALLAVLRTLLANPR
jgi:hypothetical protein